MTRLRFDLLFKMGELDKTDDDPLPSSSSRGWPLVLVGVRVDFASFGLVVAGDLLKKDLQKCVKIQCL